MLGKLWKKLVNWETISYLIFGVLTTLVDWISYWYMRRVGTDYRLATAGSWAAAVLFAFVTNKLFVFSSKSFVWGKLRYELVTFLACRLLTGGLDIGIMFIAVDIMNWNGTVWKIVSNIVVIILNYIASKLVIFKK